MTISIEVVAEQHARDVNNLSSVGKELYEIFPELRNSSDFRQLTSELSMNPSLMNALVESFETEDSKGIEVGWLNITAAVETSRLLVGNAINEAVLDGQIHQGRIAQGKEGATENDRYHRGLGTSSGAMYSFFDYYNENLRDVCSVGEFVEEIAPVVAKCMKISIDQLLNLQLALGSLRLERKDDEKTGKTRLNPEIRIGK